MHVLVISNYILNGSNGDNIVIIMIAAMLVIIVLAAINKEWISDEIGTLMRC